MLIRHPVSPKRGDVAISHALFTAEFTLSLGHLAALHVHWAAQLCGAARGAALALLRCAPLIDAHFVARSPLLMAPPRDGPDPD